MGELPRINDPRILVDYRTGDDAGIYRLDDGTLLVQTVDFFTPVVDDPEAFGAIAAANALSDVYAMGGRPITALSIAAVPDRDFPPEWTAAIFRGGAGKLREAGCALLGGHTVRDPEIKFGYAVTGIVEEAALLTNAGARPGDILVLTKPLGTGVIATAQKNARAPEVSIAASTLSMSRLNRIPAEMARRYAAHAATDITGFGLIGHGLGLARESRVGLEIDTQALPLLPGARELAQESQSGGLKANRRQFESKVDEEPGTDPALVTLAYDPQTSGGLLLSVPEDRAKALLLELTEARRIGRAVATTPGRIVLRA
ncbi:MAG: selenide, water dikinase SelD [Vicinamibacteria bacterium]|nr:selenide, water dikinase SelD [Vicinamibacteria bacterium]